MNKRTRLVCKALKLLTKDELALWGFSFIKVVPRPGIEDAYLLTASYDGTEYHAIGTFDSVVSVTVKVGALLKAFERAKRDILDQDLWSKHDLEVEKLITEEGELHE